MATAGPLDDKTVRLGDTAGLHRTRDTIVIRDFNQTLDFLKQSGSEVRRLEFSNRNEALTADQVRQIGHHIERYASGGLQSLLLHYVGSYLISDTSTVFHHVKSLAVRNTRSTDNLRIDEIFPALQHLRFFMNSPSELPSLVRQYRHLEHLDFEEFVRSGQTTLRGILANNPRLRSLKINDFPDTEVLRLIEQLPQLNALDAVALPPGYKPSQAVLNLTHLTHLKLTMNNERTNTLTDEIPVNFPSLQSVDIDAWRMSRTVANFLEKNTELTALSLPFVADFPLSRLAALIEPMHKLTQVTMAWPTFNRIAPDAATTLAMMQRFQAFTFVVDSDSLGQELLKIVAGEWKLVQKSSAHERLYLKFARV